MAMSAREVAKMRKRRERGRGKGKWRKTLKEGDTFLRIGPPWDRHANSWKDRFFHGKYKDKVYCAKNDVDEDTGKERRCLVCRRAEKCRKGDPLWALIAQKSESLWNTLEGKFKEKHGDPVFRKLKDSQFQIWQVSYQPTQDLFDFFSEERYRKHSELGIADLKVGCWVRVHRRGTGKDTKWKFELLDPSPISESRSERHRLEKTLINLDDVVKGSSDEELEAFLEKMEKKAKSGSSSSGSSSSGSSSEDKKKSSSSSSASSSSGGKEDKKKKPSSSSASDDKKGSGSSSSDDNKKAGEVYKEMKDSLDKKGKKDKDKKKESGSDDKKESKKDKKKSSSGSSSSSEDKKGSGSGSGSSSSSSD